MKFVNPYVLNLLWALIPVFGIMVYGIRKRTKILYTFARPDMLPSIIPGFAPERRWIKAVLVIIGLGFAIVALSGPQLGYKWENITQKGVDIMIALDCSKSMLAQDIKPNRLERAKREIIDLLHMMKSDRAGLVAFSGRAILQCPLTLDHEAFHIFLKVLEPGFLPVGGTNLEAAVRTCYEGFEKDSDTEKTIIIITDGETTSGDVEAAAKEMAKQGVKIFCIGVGDLQGAPIPDENGGFKKDASGNIVLSKVDTKTLEKIAAMTGGTYVRSVAGDMDLDLIYTDKILGGMERKSLSSGKQKIWENRYQWFLFPCLVLLMIDIVLSSKKRLKGIFIFLFVFGISFLMLQNEPAYAKIVFSSVKQGIQAFNEQKYEQAKKHFIDAQLENPDNAALYYNIGAAAYMNKEYEQAKKNFIQAAKTEDARLRHDAHYNLANTAYRMGNLEDAIKGYKDILTEFPEDKEAKENLEFVKQKKQEQEQEKSKSDKENKEKDKKKDQGKDSQKDKDSSDDREQSQDKKEQQENKDSDQDNTAIPEDKQSEQANQNQTMENMLNRLEDKPGRMMIPGLEGQYIEKDW